MSVRPSHGLVFESRFEAIVPVHERRFSTTRAHDRSSKRLAYEHFIDGRGAKIVLRLTILLVLCVFLPAVAHGQPNKPDDADKVSNDNPGRPLQMPPAPPR